MPAEMKSVNLRVSEDMHATIVALAKEQDRSITAVCTELLAVGMYRSTEIPAPPEPEPIPEPEPSVEPEFPVDEFGVRIPQVTPGKDNKGVCQRCHAIRTPLGPVPIGKDAKTRRYSFWCQQCQRTFKKEIGR